MRYLILLHRFWYGYISPRYLSSRRDYPLYDIISRWSPIVDVMFLFCTNNILTPSMFGSTAQQAMTVKCLELALMYSRVVV